MKVSLKKVLQVSQEQTAGKTEPNFSEYLRLAAKRAPDLDVDLSSLIPEQEKDDKKKKK